MKIVALDLSLTCTGWAKCDTRHLPIEFGGISSSFKAMDRIDDLRSQIYRVTHDADLVIMEDLAFASHDTKHERAGLAMLIRFMLWKKNIKYVLVAPTTLKKFVLGSGKGEKSQMMLEVFKRWNHDVKNDNEADALGLLHIGLMLTGNESPGRRAAIDVGKTLIKSHPWLEKWAA